MIIGKQKAKRKIVKDDFVKKVGEGEDEVEIRLPSMSYLKSGLVRRIRRLNPADAVFTLIEICLGEDSDEMDVVDNMDPEAYDAFLEEWSEHSGISLGES